MITLANLQDSFPYLIKDENTFARLQTDFPEILADLVSFKNNPNCSCRARVIKYFSDKLQQDPGLLNKYIVDQTGLQNALFLAQQIRQSNNYSGKIITIPKTEEAWRNLSMDINNGKMFRAFSVVEKEDSLIVYFL